MSSQDLSARGRYFEEFNVGDRIITPARTIGEADVAHFAGLSGDFMSIHTDAEYARRTYFGQRVAHGLLCMSIASGLAARTGVLEGTVLAFREIQNWKFSKPVLFGDTIHAVLEIQDAKPLPRLGGGQIQLVVDVRNQADESVMKGVWLILVQSKPSPG
jgi:3-hydroxybutyryl-CoA dehydratase